jgi:hypothetical protein
MLPATLFLDDPAHGVVPLSLGPEGIWSGEATSPPHPSLAGFSGLLPGWNGYNAPPPNQAALAVASALIVALESRGLAPTHVSPSAVGGVGVTRRGTRGNGRFVYVQCSNDGRVLALFSDDGEGEPVVSRVGEFGALAEEIRAYLGKV